MATQESLTRGKGHYLRISFLRSSESLVGQKERKSQNSTHNTLKYYYSASLTVLLALSTRPIRVLPEAVLYKAAPMFTMWSIPP